MTTIDLSRAILQSEYEKELPDGMGVSLPVPALYDTQPCLALFVYCVEKDTCTPPRGVFYIQYPNLKIYAYRREESINLREERLPVMSISIKRNTIKTLENTVEPFMAFYPQLPANKDEIGMVKKYHEALYVLSGDAIIYYKAVFPDYFHYIDLIKKTINA